MRDTGCGMCDALRQAQGLRYAPTGCEMGDARLKRKRLIARDGAPFTREGSFVASFVVSFVAVSPDSSTKLTTKFGGSATHP